MGRSDRARGKNVLQDEIEPIKKNTHAIAELAYNEGGRKNEEELSFVIAISCFIVFATWPGPKETVTEEMAGYQLFYMPNVERTERNER